MIRPLNSQSDATKIIRQKIIELSGLSNDRVLNIDSVRGINLAKIVENSIMSIDIRDCIILFQNRQTSSESYSQQIDETSVLTSTMNEFAMTIYGNSSTVLANGIAAKILIDINQDDLYDSGIHVIEVSDLQDLTEFKNETMWHRTDFNIVYDCMYKYECKSYDSFEKIELKKPIVVD